MSATDTSDATEHNMFIAIGILAGFVVAATAIAGSGPKAGHAMVALMLLLVLMQGIGHYNPLATWLHAHPTTGPTP